MIAVNMQKVLETGIALSTERDRNHLFDLIITAAMEITSCDAGTLYICDNVEKTLRFKIMRNHTMNTYQGGHGEEVNLPPVPLRPENICSYCALLRKSVNIVDVYNSDEFDFSGPKNYDRMTGYRTQSMLVIPLEDTRGEVIGVLQLINAQDEAGKVIGFSVDHEVIIASLASQAAIAITNSNYLADIKELFNSFVRVMITAIDQMSPYNVHHTQKLTEYASSFVDYLNDLCDDSDSEGYFDDNRREQFIMAAWLHDIGKLVTPLEVMNKATRLEAALHDLLMRIDIGVVTTRLAMLEGGCTEQQYRDCCAEAAADKQFIERVNTAGFLNDDDLAAVEKLRSKSFVNLQGERQPLLTDSDYDNLSIRKGTLTAAEREIMQDHVKLTSKLLGNIRFGRGMENIPKFASMHHEFLDGSGYPFGIKGDELPAEARMLSIIDIYEALTSSDRPYKQPMPAERAFAILESMVNEGKLDGELVRLFRSCQLPS